MGITIGTQLGFHEITALLGKGGMGEVYRARDLKLKREVAIKVLPDEFSRDADRVSRFQREAEVLAALNHPNIAAIYDFEEANETRFLVLELVEGETLADRILRGRFGECRGFEFADNGQQLRRNECWCDSRHRRIHVTGTGPGFWRGQAQRHFCVWVRSLRNAHGSPGISG